MNPVSVSYRYIGTCYRFGMGDFGDIGIGLNILLTDTDILVSVSVYRYRSNSTYKPKSCTKKLKLTHIDELINLLVF